MGRGKTIVEQAQRVGAQAGDALPRARPEQGSTTGRIEKVLHLAFPREAARDAGPTAPARDRDFAGAIELVRDAAQSIKAAEIRAASAEARMEELVQRATEELRAADARAQRAEERARAAEAKAADAADRLREAEEWLGRIYAVIAEELPQRSNTR